MTKGIRDIKDIGMIARDDFLTCLSEQQKESYYSPIKKYPLDLPLKREEKEQRSNDESQSIAEDFHYLMKGN